MLMDVDLSRRGVTDAALIHGLGDALGALRYLRSLSLARNNITSRALPALLRDALRGLPCLAQVDLQGNAGITAASGRAVLDFAWQARALVVLALGGTGVAADVVRSVDRMLADRVARLAHR
jgi:hypothetical protein